MINKVLATNNNKYLIHRAWVSVFDILRKDKQVKNISKSNYCLKITGREIQQHITTYYQLHQANKQYKKTIQNHPNKICISSILNLKFQYSSFNSQFLKDVQIIQNEPEDIKFKTFLSIMLSQTSQQQYLFLLLDELQQHGYQRHAQSSFKSSFYNKIKQNVYPNSQRIPQNKPPQSNQAQQSNLQPINPLLKNLLRLSKILQQLLQSLNINTTSNRLQQLLFKNRFNNRLDKNLVQQQRNQSLNNNRQQKQQLQNLIIQIEERKVFYSRLNAFVNKVIQELCLVIEQKEEKISADQQKNKIKARSQTSKKKNGKNNDKGLFDKVNNNFFQRIFVRQNYTEIVPQNSKNLNQTHNHNDDDHKIKQSTDAYQKLNHEDDHDNKWWFLRKSKKLQQFNFLRQNQYQTNYVLKLRLMISLMGQIKSVYQNYLLNSMNKNFKDNFSAKRKRSKQEIQNLPQQSVYDFMQKKIITSLFYSQLIEAYFNLFSEESIKTYILTSVSHHNPQISQFSKQLIDVKIRQTQFGYDLKKLCTVYNIKPNQWLFNQQDDYRQQTSTQPQNNQKQQHQKSQLHQSQTNQRLKKQFKSHKKLNYEYIKLLVKLINKEKQLFVYNKDNKLKRFLSQGQIMQINNANTKYQAQKQNKNQEICQINARIINQKQQKNQEFSLTHNYGISLNQFLPHSIFNITNIAEIEPFIHKQLLPLMINPYQQYLNISLSYPNQIINSNNHYYHQKYQKVSWLLNQLQHNVLFLNRFQQWSLYHVIEIQQFSCLYFKNQASNILNDLCKIALLKQQASSNSDSKQYQISNIDKNQYKFPHITNFCKILNILYSIKNHISRIHVNEYINSIQKIEKNFLQLLKNHLTKNLQCSIPSLIQTIDYLISNVILNNSLKCDKNKVWVLSMMRFRSITVFLDMKAISYQQYFNLFIKQSNKQPAIIYSHEKYLYYADGLQKSISILNQFKQYNKKDYEKLIKTNPSFKLFVQNKILKNQTLFNGLLQKIQSLQYQQSKYLKQKNKDRKFKDQKHAKNGKLTKKTCQKQNNHPQNAFLFNFVYNNDLLYTNAKYDQQILVDFLSSAGSSQQKLNGQPNNISQTEGRNNFQNQYNILLVLSQNSTFLSSTVKLSYNGYLKSRIEQYHLFDKWILSWNFPYYADIALYQTRLANKKAQKLYLKLHTTKGIRAGGKYFKEELTSNDNFLRLPDYPKNQYLPIQLLHYPLINGVQTQNSDITMLKLKFSSGSQILNTIESWFQNNLKFVTKQNTQPQQKNNQR